MEDLEGSFFLYITGFDEDMQRRTFYEIFSQYGPVKKLYVDQNQTFAKVYFETKEQAIIACIEGRKRYNNWYIQLQKENFKSRSFVENPSNCDLEDMASYEDFDNVEESYDYVDVHGRGLVVLEAETGDIFIPLREIRRTGFAIFRKDNYDVVLSKKRQVLKEFEMHLLAEARSYMLKNKTHIDQEQILNTIKRCATILGCEDLPQNERTDQSRSVVESPNNQITITKKVTPIFQSTASPERQLRLPKQSLNHFHSNLTQVNTNKNAINESNAQLKQQEEKKQAQSRPNWKRHSSFNSSASSASESNGFANKNNFRKSKDNFEYIDKVKLEIQGLEDVIVSSVEKKNICWVQLKSNADSQETLLIKILDLAPSERNMEPIVGKLCLAEFEDTWNRGRIIGTNPLKVFFIDFGNVSVVEKVKTLNEELRKVPAQAVKITATIAMAKDNFIDGTELTISALKQNNDESYMVKVLKPKTENNVMKKTSAPVETNVMKKAPAPVEPIVKEAPKSSPVFVNNLKPLSVLRNEDKVMLIDVGDNGELFVRTKECYAKVKEITDHIKNLDTSDHLTNVKNNQLVLCSKDGSVGLFRAVIKKVDGNVVNVKYIDYPGDTTLAVKSLRNMDEFLSKCPITLLVVPKLRNSDNFGDKSMYYINKMIEEKAKLVLIHKNDKYDLQLSDGSYLSKILNDLENPPPPSKPKTEEIVVAKPEAQPTKITTEIKEEPVEIETKSTPPAKIMFDHMNFFKVDLGVKTYMCFSLKAFDDMTILPLEPSGSKYLKELMDYLGDIDDEEPYVPEQFEMCLAKYKAEGDTDESWNRVVVIGEEKDDLEVLFVDYGNSAFLKPEKLRKFTAELMEIPILGLSCTFVGIPNKPEVLNRLKELILDGDSFDIDIKEIDEDQKLHIEIPSVYETLRKDGLLK